MSETTKSTIKKSKQNSSKAAAKESKKSTAKSAAQSNVISENFIFELTLPAEVVARGRQTALANARTRLSQNGFRKGKTPDKIVEQAVGQQYLLQQTLEAIVPPAYEQALKDKKLQPLTEPDIKPVSMEEGKDWTFEVTIANRPVIDVSKYSEIVSKTKSSHDLWRADKKAADSKSKKTAATEKSAKSAKSGSSESASEDQTTSDKNQTEESEDAEAKLRQEKLQALISALLEKIAVPVPDLLLRHETQAQLHELEHQLEHLKMSFDDFLKNSGKTREDVEKDYAARALGNLQVELLLGAIIQAAKLKNTEAELGAVLQQRMNQYPEESRPKITARDVQYVNALLLKQKALDHLLNL